MANTTSIAHHNCRRLVLDDHLGEDQARALLAPVAFADWRAAHRALQHMAESQQERQALAASLPYLLAALTHAANPDRVLANFERFATSFGERLALFDVLANNPRAVELLVMLFAGSQFLSEILLATPEYFQQLTDRKYLANPKSRDQLMGQARASTASCATVDDQLDALRRFQRRELLRIGAGDLFDYLSMPAVAGQLSRLADSLVRLCLEIVARQSDVATDDFVVIGLGKLGGEELNYSSDIDLLFLARTDAGRYRRLGERLIAALSRVTAHGFLYRVDMRLRPWGSDGMLVSSLDGHTAYLEQHAQLWEKQALLKARVIAGGQEIGDEFTRRTESILVGRESRAVRGDIHGTKQRTEAHLRQRGREWGEVKLGVGSIRDVEFVTQYLQLIYGPQHPQVRGRNTLYALERLAANGFLSADEYRVLSDGYIFLRTIEHHLQMMDYRQTASLPGDDQAIFQLARRLGFEGEGAGAQFVARYEEHCGAIRRVYQHFLESSDTMAESTNTRGEMRPQDFHRHLARMDASYSAAFDQAEIKQHAVLAGQLDPDNLVEVRAVPVEDGRWRVTIVAYDYPGELSLICGLLFIHGFSILDGHVFTYEPLAEPPRSRRRGGPSRRLTQAAARQKIVDVFTVQPVRGEVSANLWSRYRDDLAELLGLMHAGERRQARGELAKRVAVVMRAIRGTATTLYPVDIEIDNTLSDRYTVLKIDAPDTVGFLYEFSNALAINRVYIAQMTVDSVGNRVEDILYVTDERGQKITAPEKQRELRAATVLIKHFTHLLPLSPDPETALLHFREFLGKLFARPDWPDELASLERHQVLDALARLLGVSEFLWDDFLRMQYANLIPVVRDVDELATAKSKEELGTALQAALAAAPDGAGRRDALNAFKDREMFRVDMRHILGHIAEFGQFSAELTDLAEVVVEAAYHLCQEELQARFGLPMLADGSPCTMSVCALGKCGGRELGFASDVELMFIFTGNGETGGPDVITNAEFYERLVQAFIAAIRAKREGVFEVDLQLRPYGQAGSMAVSLEAFRRYFAPEGEAWAYERQALVKLRPIAGDVQMGEEIVALRDAFVYGGEPFDVAAMRAMRERQIRHLVTGGTLNAKHSPGGLVDVEYIVQGLQINHGHDHPSLRRTNTGQAMAALADAGILEAEDHVQLREALIFLRRLINALRMVRGSAKDLTVPPAESEEFSFLARRLGYAGELDRLREDLTRHTSRVQELSRRLLRQV